jgi:hypothetical protein
LESIDVAQELFVEQVSRRDSLFRRATNTPTEQTWFIQGMFIQLTLFVGTMFGACEETLNDSIAFFDRRGTKDEHRTGIVFVVEGRQMIVVHSHRTVENQGEETRLSVKQTNVAEILAGQRSKPEGSDSKLFALNVEFDRRGRRTENRTFEELLDFTDQITLRVRMMIDVEMTEKVNRRERVDRLMMEGQRRLRIDQIHAGRQRRIHVFQKNHVVDLFVLINTFDKR